MRIGAVARALCILLAEVVLIQTWPVPARAQEQEPTKLDISILEGEGSINNIRQRVAREAMVQVDDENHKPVAGVAVTFFLPEHGASGVFSNGTHSLTVMTVSYTHLLQRGGTLDSRRRRSISRMDHPRGQGSDEAAQRQATHCPL